MNGFYYIKVWELSNIKDVYQNIEILKNEKGICELGFNNVESAEYFIDGASKIWPNWCSAEDTVTMNFFADIIEKMYNNKFISKNDLYKLSEKEIVEQITNCEDKEISESFKKFMGDVEFIESDEKHQDKFCVNWRTKRRYINPLTPKGRLYNVSVKSKEIIDNFKNMPISKYVYINYK